jgi:hypothetical protein
LSASQKLSCRRNITEKLEGGAGVGVLVRANVTVVDNLQGGKVGQMLLRLLPLHKKKKKKKKKLRYQNFLEKIQENTAPHKT